MKRLPALFIAMLFVLVGCGANEPTVITINRSFCCPVAVEQNGLHFEAELTVTQEQCTAVFLQPETMKGMKMTCRNDRITVQYGQSTSETPLSKPQQCFLFWLNRALLAQPDAAVTRKENAYALQGMVENQKFLLTIDRESFQPLYFEMDSLDLAVKFQNGA